MKGRRVHVCAECTQKCLLFHGKKKNSLPLVSSFFKVMIGDGFSRVLYLPPKFCSSVSALVDRKVILEDSSEQQWEVTLSIVNDSLAFHEGWNTFSLEHGLKVGDFLVFYYIKGSHFIVNIYDRSGCEKLDFAKHRNLKKRGRKRKGSAARGDSYGMNAEGMLIRECSSVSIVPDSVVPETQSQHKVIDVEGPLIVCDSNVLKTRSLHLGVDAEAPQNNVKNTSEDDNSKGRNQSVSKLEHFEDPCYMIDREFGGKEREDRIPFFDVLTCEIWNNSGVDRTVKTTTSDAEVPHFDNKSHASQNEESLCHNDLLHGGILGGVAPSEAIDFDLTAINDSFEDMAYARVGRSYRHQTSKHHLTSSIEKERTRENKSSIFNCEVETVQFAEGIVKEEIEDMAPDACSYKGLSKVIEGGTGQSSHATTKDHDGVLQVVKAEPVEDSWYQFKTTSTSTASRVVPPANDLLELHPGKSKSADDGCAPT
ncbi:hypothetical protein L6164_014816 [Bauhinia variegata]|uniref:Uncharacterized protein n=1 Tax=Bauhinia variegata TaxID=167791 RepID=A0ACB9NM90_BAUVA|nr:hypothetical protein L6164_014816 [Bauhinia variegata]